MKIVLATANKGKIKELKDLLAPMEVEVLSISDFPGLALPPEAGSTFEENALEKARFVARFTRLPALADDSGLVVDALGGRPGVYSARYAGEAATDEDNYMELLRELDGVSAEKRTARFVCVAAFVEPGGEEATFEGDFEGVISQAPSGEGGFGYDPVFFVPERGKTAAQMTMEEKNSMSHRAKALGKFKKYISGKKKKN